MITLSQQAITTLVYLALGYLGVFTAFFLFSDFFIFLPPKPSTFTPSQSTHTFKAGDKKIRATYLPNPNSKYTLLYSHGNAEDLGVLHPLLEYYHQRGYSVFAYDYEGYGQSEGHPSESHTYRDILAAYHYMQEDLNIPSQHIVVLGRSLGSGPSLFLASQYPVAGLILEAPFVTAFRTITHYPLFPYDKFRNINRIQNVKVPILIIHGKKDTIIPFWHGKLLYKKASEPKYHLWVNQGNHNNILIASGETYWETLNAFMHALSNR